MEPSDQYLKSKRNLVLFSGFLALSATVGLDFTSKEGSSLLPVSLKDVNFLDEIFAVLVLYFAFQTSLFWSAQTTTIQRLPQYKWDFWTTMLIAVAALFTYVSPIINLLATIVAHYLVRLLEERLPWLNLNLVRLSAIAVSVFLVTFTFYKMVSSAHEVVQEFRRSRKKDEQMILSVLADYEWRLIFNPSSPKGSKKIVFADDGTVKESRNDNENTWRIREGLLEILNSQGQVFSRFRYDAGQGCFVHTNDDDTLSLRSQRIEPWEVANRDH